MDSFKENVAFASEHVLDQVREVLPQLSSLSAVELALPGYWASLKPVLHMRGSEIEVQPYLCIPLEGQKIFLYRQPAP
jgi:hypothetical protein